MTPHLAPTPVSALSDDDHARFWSVVVPAFGLDTSFLYSVAVFRLSTYVETTMNLQPVPQNHTIGEIPRRHGLGHVELGWCLNPEGRADCHPVVRDDGTGYADLDGPPFKAYVCHRCASHLLAA